MDSTNIKPASPRPHGVGKWLIVTLLCAIAACLAIEVSRGTPAAMAQPSAAAPDGTVIAFPAQLSADGYGICLLDTRRGTIAVYQYQQNNRTLRLLAVRNYGFDVQLDEYNTEPSPDELRKLVQQQKRLGDSNDTE